MPELPEVQTVVNTLLPHLTGKTIRACELRRADFIVPAGFDLASNLVGRSITEVMRRAKRIIIRLENGRGFYIHLGMTGRLTFDSPETPERLHTHFVLTFDSGELRLSDPRRFGGIWWLGGNFDDEMGPEPLKMRPAQLARQLSRTTRAIKNALLDQTVVAGLGNIYVDESLFRAGIHPLKPADQLSASEVAILSRSIKAVLNRALRHRGSTLRDYMDADGNSGAFQKFHSVYNRTGLPCRKCKAPVNRIVLGGRSTHYCENCQPVHEEPRTKLRRSKRV